VDRAEAPVYVQIAEKAMQLRDLRMSDKAIALALGVSDKTVAKAIELRTKHRGPTGVGRGLSVLLVCASPARPGDQDLLGSDGLGGLPSFTSK
jgi:hypothetical protein